MRVLGCILAALMCFLYFMFVRLRGVGVLRYTCIVRFLNVDSLEMGYRTAAKEMGLCRAHRAQQVNRRLPRLRLPTRPVRPRWHSLGRLPSRVHADPSRSRAQGVWHCGCL